MLKWLKKLKAIVSSHDADMHKLRTDCANDVQRLRERVVQMETLVRDRTNIAVDVGFKNESHVIVMGRYKNVDYVQSYALNTPDFAALIEQLRQMKRHGAVRWIDAPPQFRAVFEREF